MFNNVTLIVKPTLDCNLKCKYCYAKESKYNYKGQRMSLDVVKKALDVFTKRFDVIDWIWHGGEPMLVSAEWYK
ncbi:MAG: radical SAM protein, partial [bacterium]|nr:radical SAM protein [bacterium]